jgi:drug/metabolite transporter (DMT)-like permease
MNPWLPLILAVVGWGASNVLGKAVLNSGLDTFTYLPIRYTIAIIAVGIFLVGTRRWQQPGASAWGKGAILGLVNMSLPTMFMTRGFEYIPASVGSLLIALIPIATVAAAHFVVPGERFQMRTLPGLLVSLLGVGLLIDGGQAVVPSRSDLILGVVLVTVGVMIGGLGGAVSRRFARVTPATQLIIPQFTTGLVALLLGFAVFGETTSTPIDPNVWRLILASGIIGTAVPFAAFLFAAELNPASRLGATGYIVPIIATVGAVVFLGETFTATMLAAAVLILFGVFWSEKAARYVPAPGARTTA